MPPPTPKALRHKARGCADPGATPGPGRSAFPTPQGVVPFMPAGGDDKQGRNGIVFSGAEEESARNVCPLSTQYTHLTCHPFEPSAQPRWDSRRRIGPTGGGQCPSTPHSREIGQGSSPHAHPSATRSTPNHTRHRKSVNAQPHAPSPFPGTNGAIHPSLGYSPRKRDIETIQGLKARHHPVDSWGRDMSGLQPFGSIIMPDTQAGGLGSHRVCLWRDGKAGQSPFTEANQGNETRKALCSLRLLLFHFRFGPTTFCALPKRLL